MTDPSIMNSDAFKRCETFHGHVCPGLCLGFKAAQAAMAWLNARQSEDEEIVAIVETDACSADAVQVVTGCTFGKGNFIFRDHGKMVLTLLRRDSGQGVRVSLKAGAFRLDAEHLDLIQKITRAAETGEERLRFNLLHAASARKILEMPDEALFVITPVTMEMPDRARIEPSEPCAHCGEPTMRTKMAILDDQKICRECLALENASL